MRSVFALSLPAALTHSQVRRCFYASDTTNPTPLRPASINFKFYRHRTPCCHCGQHFPATLTSAMAFASIRIIAFRECTRNFSGPRLHHKGARHASGWGGSSIIFVPDTLRAYSVFTTRDSAPASLYTARLTCFRMHRRVSHRSKKTC
ncbi:hypothetical protein EDD15DRAFT_1898874 [Pisolithus albus]|nr:hypothetical protein EDD15DRAFT_1898874 [Pisolithus albus]